MKNSKALVFLLVLITAAAGLRSRRSAHAAAPENTDPNSPLAKWFGDLKQPPNYKDSCCSLTDCRKTIARLKLDDQGRPMYDAQGRERWEAIYPQTLHPDTELKEHWWIDVKPEIVIPDDKLPLLGPEGNQAPYNLAEEAVLCAYMQAARSSTPGMYCFVRPPSKG